MKLITGSGQEIHKPDQHNVAEVMHEILSNTNNFIALVADDDEEKYIYTIGDPRLGFMIEYKEGPDKTAYQTTQKSLKLHTVIENFQEYLAGNTGWKENFEWETPRNVTPRKFSARPLTIIFIITIVLLVMGYLARIQILD